MNTFIRDNWFKIGILIILLIIVLCVAYYFIVLVQGERYAKNQQQLELDRKEYIADQKKACLEIYQAEIKKWNNVNDWNYNDYKDKCVITYNVASKDKKSPAQCEEAYSSCKKILGDLNSSCFSENLNCLAGTFTKEF